MKKVKVVCLQNFTGIVCMTKGEEKTVDSKIANDLERAGYVNILGKKEQDPKTEE